MVWGTDVSVSSVRAKFKRFVETFMVTDAEEDERMDGYNRSEPFYLQKLEEVEYRHDQLKMNNLSRL